MPWNRFEEDLAPFTMTLLSSNCDVFNAPHERDSTRQPNEAKSAQSPRRRGVMESNALSCATT
jgi:hypothetical protein